jgi:pyruvate/2-oxoglutarate dehydrogenase complex dihydrolipoamide acyltransferase (E2) component
VLLYGRIDLGLWRDTGEGRTLMLLLNAADLSLRGIERAIADGPRAAAALLTAAMPATFTIVFTDAGWWGEAIIPTGSAALLHVGSAESRVVVDPATEQLAIRRRRLLALIYDARYIAQSEADSLLRAVRERVEQRRRL